MNDKKLLSSIAAFLLSLFLMSCAEQDISQTMTDSPQKPLPADSRHARLVEQARWGDGAACLQLAESYRAGEYAGKGFLDAMTMLSLASRYGGISSLEDYMKALSPQDALRQFYNALEGYDRKDAQGSMRMIDGMIANGHQEGAALKAFVTVELGDTVGGRQLLTQAARQGSMFAELLLTVMPGRGDWKHPDIDKLMLLADRTPLACKLLGDYYAGLYDGEGIHEVSDSLAAMYYRRADEHGYLGSHAARWLLGYYLERQCPVAEAELERLSILSGFTSRQNVPDTTSTTYNDPVLEDTVRAVLSSQMTETGCDRGIVYVVETACGRLKAHVCVSREGGSLVPYNDTYNQGRSSVVAAADYLALLSSGKVSSDTVYDTGNGIYGNIRDHNYHRGGYGSISLERALGVCSVVAFTMAREDVYGEDTDLYQQTVDSYLGGAPGHTMGILTFYNAVANGGCMVRIVSEGDDSFILNEQIADKEHIASLQRALRSAVTDGIFRKATSPDTEVAACGRILDIGEGRKRMELCGYFPADRPQYTVMVIMEKAGLPASAGGICGPVMGSISSILTR